ncbi:MAG: flavin reductase family protein [bacterium]
MTTPEAVVDTAEFRRVLGRYVTGVVVVASQWDGQQHGITVNSFTSVSLDPPLIAFCAAHSSNTWPSVRAAGRFAVSILADTQQEVCGLFATKGVDRFAAVPWTRSPSGHPILEEAVGWLDCRVDAIHPAGDHDLVVGEVTALGADDGMPLVFFQGAFAELAPPADVPTAAERTAVGAAMLPGIDVESPFFDVLSAHLRSVEGQDNAEEIDSRSIAPVKSHE